MSQIKLVNQKDWILVGLVLVICALAFLPQVGSLGYYHDDWFPTISHVSDVGLVEMHWGDRPMMGRWYALVDKVLGEAPLAWHLFAFLARFAGALGLYVLARVLWPEHHTAAAAIALIYGIYPGFLQQTSANNYQNHITAYAIAIFSLLFSVLAVKAEKIWQKAALTVAAAGFAAFYPRIYEAMIGMEGFRFFLIWVVVRRRTGGKFLTTLRDSVIYFLPFLVVAGQFIYWRFFVFTSSRVSTDSELILDQLRSEPFMAAGMILLTVITDFFEMTLGGWIIPAYQLGLSARLRSIALALGVGLAAVAAVLLVLRWLRVKQEPQRTTNTDPSNWTSEAVWLGVLGILITLLPVALTGRDVEYRIYYDRYTYPSIAPAAFLLTGLIFAAIKSSWRIYAISLLVFLAVFTHNLNASAYARNWDFQKQAWWQLSWRAPGIEKGTTLIMQMPQAYRYPEDFEIWAPASRIYYPGPGPLQITAEVLNAETIGVMLNRERVNRNYRGVIFVRDFNQVLVTSMPTEESCLQVLDGSGPVLSTSEDALVKQVAQISRLDHILTDTDPVTPPSIVFGKEPEHDWCYTYQKASLAQQQGNWAEVARLGDEATAEGLSPRDIVEYAPFFEGYLHAGRSEDAARIATILKDQAPTVAVTLCSNFKASENPDDLQIASDVRSLLCEE